MFKKLTALFISILLVVGCMAVPVMAAEEAVYSFTKNNCAESSMGSWGDMWVADKHYVTFDISQLPEGNYRIDFSGQVLSTANNLPLEFVCEVDGNDTINGMLDNGNSVSSTIGVVSIDSNSKTMKFSPKRGGYTMGWTFTLTRVGDYDKAGSYRFDKIFKNDSTQVEYNAAQGYALWTPGEYIGWTADIAYDGVYDVIFYGGVQSWGSTATDMAFGISVEGTDVINASAPWTGTGDVNYLGQSTTSNMGWVTHKYTKVGSVALKKGVKTIRFTCKSSVAHTGYATTPYPSLIFIRTGDIIPLNAPEITTVRDEENLSNSKVVIDFDRDIVNTPANLALITTSGGYGTATVAVDSEDASKVIVTGVAGKFTVNASAGFAAADGKTLAETTGSECYIPSCKVTQYAVWPQPNTGTGTYYVQATVNTTQGKPSIQIWLALYNDKNELVAVGGNPSCTPGWSGEYQFSVSTGLKQEEYMGKYTTAKMFVWEQDMTPLMTAYDTKGTIEALWETEE